MIETKVLINSVEKVKNFSAAISAFGAECEIIKDYNIIDAKSIMGIFSINLDEPVTLRIHSDNPEILEKIKEWIAE
ncbi:MAG TPA: HPr family phosphocarrier protein [Oscillospiraceae bacterium]|jgi:phosphotransferase system HPr-like phosphotransfer protein|nr:HPr family phosphocarrier protein [Oscillospiraceae bacterium]HOV41470.1 HPr family phosphocarrier protein [Oscillospiraceae bacterium]